MSWFDAAWHWYLANAAAINPIGAFVGAVGAFATAATLAWAAVQNARTAARNADTAALRHEEQTKADRQRRLTESFSKAIEQLASEKIEARLGGIYTLEQISRESPDHYWIVMETLTAFLREHARWKERDEIASETPVSLHDDENSESRRPKPATDIAAVLTVIARRADENIDSEKANNWTLDFSGCDLRGAKLVDVHLERANFWEAHLEVAYLSGAHLERANLVGVHLERARLERAHLEVAYLTGAHLERARLFSAELERAHLQEAHLEGAGLSDAHLKGALLSDAHLVDAHLQRANLAEAHLEGANLKGANLAGAHLEGAHLEGACLGTAEGLLQDQISEASGNGKTTLPPGLTRPEHWPHHGVCAGGTSLS